MPSDTPNILIDRFMFREAITNLIANSIRYTDIGGKIKVSFKKTACLRRTGRKTRARYCVPFPTTALAFPDEDKDKIFARFYRANNAMRKVPDGSGPRPFLG